MLKEIKNGLQEVREQKIDVDPKTVEKIVDEFIIKYDIDRKITEFVRKKIFEFHKPENYDLIIKLAGREELEGYPLFFDVNWFKEIENYVKDLIRSSLKKEFEENPNMDETRALVLKNMDTHINLTLSPAGIDKLTLVAYHYFIKNITEICKEFVKKYSDKFPKRFNKQKLAAEVYNLEIMTLLATHEQLKGYVTTIISLTATWMQKYKKKSKKLGNSVNELMMMTEHVIIDKIVRYMIFSGIKNTGNKSPVGGGPLKLRSIFSNALSLIHRNIISFLSMNLVDVKIGFVRAVQHLYTEDINYKVINKHQMIVDAVSKVLKNKNKKQSKPKHHIFNTFKGFTEINPIDFFEFMNPNFNIVDNLYFYVSYGQYTKQSSDTLANGIYLDKKIVSKKNYKKVVNFLNQKIESELAPLFYKIYDKKVAEMLLTRIKNQVSDMININRYIDEYGSKPMLDIFELHDYIDLIIDKYKSNITSAILTPVV